MAFEGSYEIRQCLEILIRDPGLSFVTYHTVIFLNESKDCSFYSTVGSITINLIKALIPNSSVGRVPLWGTGGHGFDPGLQIHTKVVKNCTSCSSLGTESCRGGARTGQPSVRIM